LGLPAISEAAAALHRRSVVAPVSTASTDGWMAILITDIEGSTDVAVRLGDIAFHRLVSGHHDVVRRCLQRYGGTEFSEGGDSLLAWFPSAQAAVSCAMAIQDDVQFGAARDTGLSLRIGIAGGYPLVLDGRPWGAVVTLASRITDHVALPGEIVVDREVADRGRCPSIDCRPVTLKGFPGTQLLCRLRTAPAGR